MDEKKSKATQNVVNNQIYFFNFGDDDDYVNDKKTPFFTSFKNIYMNKKLMLNSIISIVGMVTSIKIINKYIFRQV